MKSVVFSGCRAQLHTPADGVFSHLVVLCNAFGGEGLYAHRALCVLAEDLAAAGMAALHLDYPGLGDSVDLAAPVDATQAWLDGVRAALAWARSHFPGVALSLCGHRMGALLAAEVASTEADVRALLLLSPPPSGRHLVRELQITAQPAPGGDGVFLYGWWLANATLAGLQSLDLGRLSRRPALAVQVLSDAGGRALAKLAQAHVQAGGVEFEAHEMPDLAGLRAEPHLVEAPEASFARGVQWLALHAANGARAGSLQQPALPLTDELHLSQGVESGCRFGPAEAYFGVLCRPHEAQPDRPCVLILNTGGNPRSGHHRLGVALARALAAAGVASLRMDATGIGDTLPVVRGRSLSLYSEASLVDVGHALSWLERRGWARPMVFGICSGAYLGLHAAVHEPRMGGLVMVNPQSFLWEGPAFGTEIPTEGGAPAKVEIQQLGHYWRVLFSGNFWRRLWRAEVAVAGVLRQVAKALWFRCAAALQARLPAGWALAPRAAKVQAMFGTLAKRRLPLLLVYADTDPGLNELQACFGPGGQRLLRNPVARVHLVKGADHTFTAAADSENLIQIVRQFVSSRSV